MKAVSRMENHMQNVEKKRKILEMANDRKFSFKPSLYKNKIKPKKEQKPDLKCYSYGIRPPSPMDRVLFSSKSASDNKIRIKNPLNEDLTYDEIKSKKSAEKKKMSEVKKYFKGSTRAVSAENKISGSNRQGYSNRHKWWQ